MNGIHDCGGMDGMGRVVVELNEPVFHQEWEARMFGMTWAIGMNGFWNQDEYRHAMEDRPPVDYLNDPYYAKWLYGVERLLLEKGVVTQNELTLAREIEGVVPPDGACPVFTPSMVPEIVREGFSFRRNHDVTPRFSVGDGVTGRNINIKGHTRLPRYARTKTGIVVEDRGVFSFNDSAANEGQERPQHVYAVRFSARELWGADYSPIYTVCLDLWEDHLDPAAAEDNQ